MERLARPIPRPLRPLADLARWLAVWSLLAAAVAVGLIIARLSHDVP